MFYDFKNPRWSLPNSFELVIGVPGIVIAKCFITCQGEIVSARAQLVVFLWIYGFAFTFGL